VLRGGGVGWGDAWQQSRGVQGMGKEGVSTGVRKGPGVSVNSWKGVGVAVLACLNLCSYV